MSRIRKALLFAGLLTIPAGCIVYGIFSTFIWGRTPGPDVIAAYRSHALTASQISSVEVVEPPVGVWPESEADYAALRRRKVIDSPARIGRLLDLLTVNGGYTEPRNHPGTFHRAYLKVNTEQGYYWIYCCVHEDATNEAMMLWANNLNATNLNGATTYHLGNFTALIAILEHRNEADSAPALPGSHSTSPPEQ